MIDIDFREKSVGIFKMMTDAGNIKFVGVFKKRLINTLAANDENSLTIFDNTQSQNLLHGLARDGIVKDIILVTA